MWLIAVPDPARRVFHVQVPDQGAVRDVLLALSFREHDGRWADRRVSRDAKPGDVGYVLIPD